ncbi:MAG: glycosyltransferase family 4 protein [Nitrosopumilaceae archaeon]
MRLLIGGSPSKIFHLKEFCDTLNKFDISCKLVLDSEVYDGFPSRKIRNWFQTRNKFNKLIHDFKPDVIFIDRQRHFGLAAIKSNIPLLVHLRGNYWEELKMAKNTLYKSFPKSIAIKKWEKIGNECFSNAKVILPICKYLENIIKEHYPNKPTEVLYQGITSSNWYPQRGMNLKHPCIGLLQDARIWEKTKEMLMLTKVMKAMPNVTFYWAGDGPYRDKVLPVLAKYDNFKWLGSLQYPDQVRQFLTEIDVYALISGIDMSPLTLQEAQLMEKPVVATNVGGIPELMQNNETGFLVKKQDPYEIIDKLTLLVNNENKRKQMGVSGRSFIEKNFSLDIIAKRFSNMLNFYI